MVTAFGIMEAALARDAARHQVNKQIAPDDWDERERQREKVNDFITQTLAPFNGVYGLTVERPSKDCIWFLHLNNQKDRARSAEVSTNAGWDGRLIHWRVPGSVNQNCYPELFPHVFGLAIAKWLLSKRRSDVA